MPKIERVGGVDRERIANMREHFGKERKNGSRRNYDSSSKTMSNLTRRQGQQEVNNSPVRHRPVCPKISLLVQVENLVEIWLNLVKTRLEKSQRLDIARRQLLKNLPLVFRAKHTVFL